LGFFKDESLRDWIQNAHLPSWGANIILIIEQISACAELILEADLENSGNNSVLERL